MFGRLLANPLLITPLLRIAAMAGKFLFVLYSARCLSAADFGRLGIVTAGTWIGVLFFGLEIHAVMMRNLVTAKALQARLIRGTYITFVIMAALVFALASGGLIHILGWEVSVLVGSICFFEYAGQESARLLAADAYPIRAALSIFLRSGAWCYFLVGLTVLGLVADHWSLELVLSCWLCASVAALVLLWVERGHVQLGRAAFKRLANVFPQTLQLSWRFMVSAVGLQVTLHGSRFFLGAFQSEEISGRYTLLSTLASISLIMVKGVCEPIYFPRVLGANGSKHWSPFRRSVLVAITLSTLASACVTPIYFILAGVPFNAAETPTLMLLLLTYAIAGASVVPHFRLFAGHEDRAILSATVRATSIFLLASLVLVPWLSLVGGALAACGGALWLYGDKALAVRVAARRLQATAWAPPPV